MILRALAWSENPDRGDPGGWLGHGRRRAEESAREDHDREPDPPHAAGSQAEGYYTHRRPGLDEHRGVVQVGAC
jgi:hypothetical protein